MYHPFIESLALTLVDIPITLVTQVIFAVLLYELVRLQRSVQQFLYAAHLAFLPKALTNYPMICLFSPQIAYSSCWSS